MLRARTQSEVQHYARVNSLGVFGAYSGDSSHVIMGQAEKRMFLSLGFSYERRLLSGRNATLQYSAECMPVARENDPLTMLVNHQTSPATGTYTGNLPYSMVNCLDSVSAAAIRHDPTQASTMASFKSAIASGASSGAPKGRLRQTTHQFLREAIEPVRIPGCGATLSR